MTEALLFQPLSLGRLTLPSRVVMAPMTRYRATDDGMPTDAVATYYAQRASAGLIISEGIWPQLPRAERLARAGPRDASSTSGLATGHRRRPR